MPVLTKINSNVIADDAITGDKLGGSAYLANTASQNISGTYSENRMYTSDAYTLSGNATVNSELILSSVKPNADAVLTASGAYTITGTGILSGGDMYGRTSLTGMTGELGSAVTGAPALTGLGTVTSGTLGSGVTLETGVTFPTAVGGGAGGHVVCIKRSSHNTEIALSTSWATTFGNITHTMSDSNNILFLQMYVPILVYGSSDTRGQVGFSKDNAAPFSSSGGYGYWQQQSGDHSSHSQKHCVWSDIVTPGDMSSHTWGMSAIEHTGTAIAMWPAEAKAFLILMEMTGD